MSEKYFGDEKPTLETALAHYGVKGMKWGVIRTQRSADTKAARAGLRADNQKYNALEDKRDSSASSAEKARIQRVLDKMDAEYKTDPRRAIAARTTRGEKIALALLAPAGIGAIVIGGRALRSRSLRKRAENAKP